MLALVQSSLDAVLLPSSWGSAPTEQPSLTLVSFLVIYDSDPLTTLTTLMLLPGSGLTNSAGVCPHLDSPEAGESRATL